MTSTSPLRYPGGKARFNKFIWNAIIASGELPDVFVEPFCGGAATSIALLESNRIQRIALNDADPLVASFWRIVFGKSSRPYQDIEWLINTVESSEISISEWRRQKALKPASFRAAAWKCLYLNRTSFNGIIHKAGPIGGWEQKNRTLDVRFNREKIIKRLRQLFELRERVERIGYMDWRHFCSYYVQTQKAYLYLDPPYYHRAEQLYGYLFDKEAHLAMRNYLSKLSTPWMLSYDDAPEIRFLYDNIKGIDGRVIDNTYSAHPLGGARFIGRELFFSNRSLPVHGLQEGPKLHVGMTILGTLNMVPSNSVGPVRTRISR